MRDDNATAELIDGFRLNLLAEQAAGGSPSSRCVARPQLVQILKNTQGNLREPDFRRHSATALLQLLVDAGVLRRIPITPERTDVRSDRLYAVGLDTSPDDLEPAELLQAHVPDGVICYFTALQLHELTTQAAPHHHIARLRPLSPSPERNKNPKATSGRPPPLGALQFSVDGVGYYLSDRDRRWLQATQRRRLNRATSICLTTQAQTLVDCLHRPLNAGGPAVVFEAWETALNGGLSSRIIELVCAIPDLVLQRRAGYMLSRFLAGDRSAIDRLKTDDFDSVEPFPSLLPGIPFGRSDPDWHLLVP